MDENVKFMPKRLITPNVPRTRPIENFWGCLAQKVYEGCWEANTEQQLIRRIESMMKEFDTTFVGVEGKVKSKSDNSVNALFK